MRTTTHPSIITLNDAKPTPPRGYSLLVGDIDSRYHYDTLLEGEVSLLMGEAKSGRTRKLLDIAGYNAQFLAQHCDTTVLIATVTDTAQTVLSKLTATLPDAVARRVVRVANVTTCAELAMFVAKAAAQGAKPGLLLIDDLGLLDAETDTGHVQSTTTAVQLAHGSLAAAVQATTGLPYGAFTDLPRANASLPPVAVLGTVRSPRRSRHWGSSHALSRVHNLFTLDGEVLKSRRGPSDPR